ncbi:MAG: tautomerase family protein [Desulfobacterales bacterium]|nr:tautomerase family protein [Desulfobacterales bacterium]
MPHISIEGPPLSLDKKRKLAEKFTEFASEVYEIPKEKFMIHINEFSKESAASGGVLICDK